MKRRNFIKLSSTAMFSYLYGCKGENSSTLPFEVTFRSDQKVGHTVMESLLYPKVKQQNVDYIIVGGGVSGLTSAYKLKGQDYLLFELSDRFGGSSSAENYKNTRFAQGAHYDMSYPNKFGTDALNVLLELGVIQKEGEIYEFVDKEYLINKDDLSWCSYKGEYYDDVFFDLESEEKFYALIEEFFDKITLPTSLISDELMYLDTMTFAHWLSIQDVALSEEFLLGVDYHLKDDFGADANVISALAGISYYAVRPNDYKWASTFSPPQGNAYFIDKLLDSLPTQKCKLNHIVRGIEHLEDGTFKVEVIDVQNQKINLINTKNIIYAGQKHALKYICKPLYQPFKDQKTAPWLVVNILLKKNTTIPLGAWQNEVLSSDWKFLGFVDSSTQKTEEYRVLTAYYCFPDSDREKLITIENQQNDFVNYTIENIATFLKVDNLIFKEGIEKVFMHALGHGMPIPTVNYLKQDKNKNRPYKNLVFAGVDNGRLPFLIEAIDSGISAINTLKS
ncbi:NAD(P)/FAD-dependent oxidoreductase [Flammeovirga pectinis]|uniref:NAD(P)/FAD-dependent oxidoreductase n=1 Tax=Flammeovirga pectinis TaxID=2494373 RepID=A0A3S9P3C4_9BACT|nr:NAD(P)/FAD-dependent oxidoreductase [Flammeovirga pectinis]AZQ62705.1 NAD(P)/FAD-dependent oxidoreductase [Flammeovirga pectinis]